MTWSTLARLQTPGVHEDELDRVAGGFVLASLGHRSAGRGGEWDCLRAVPRRTRRRLIGAGYLSPRGEMPDVFADIVAARGGPETTDEAVAWYVRTACRALVERRRRSWNVRHHRVAMAAGFASYWQYRTATAGAGNESKGTNEQRVA